MKILATLSILGLLFLVACSGGEQDASQTSESANQSQTATHGAGDGHGHEGKASDSNADETSHAHAGEVTLVGQVGCGHCSYQVGTSCSAAIKTTEGEVYILDVAEDSETFQHRYSGRSLEVTGVVSDKGDTYHVTVDKIRAL